MPINPAIAMGVRGLELPDPLEQFSRFSAIQNAQQQNALANMKMEEYGRSRREQEEIRNKLAGGASFDSPDTVNFLLGSETGRDILKRRAELQKSETDEAARRAKLAVDTEAMYRNMMGMIGNKQDATAFLQRMVNDPALKGSPISQIPLMDQVRRIPDDPKGLENWVKQFAIGSTKWVTENKPVDIKIDRNGQTDVYTRPGLDTTLTLAGSYKDVPLPTDVAAQRERLARAGASNISVSTEKKYGEAFGGEMAKVDISKMNAAEGAPALAESANRIMGLVQQGNLFTGPIADIKLNIARAFNVAGASNEEKIANTEQLIAATGQSTLNAIKGAGLGTGQGFTDKDLKFLQGVAGGTINLTAQTLTELARLQHRVAEKTADAWNRRRQEMPKDVASATGLSMTPITIPPLQSGVKKGAARPEGVGANWTLMTDKNGVSAWVSPDRKQHVEVP